MVIINEELQGFEVLGYFQCIIGSIFGGFGSKRHGSHNNVHGDYHFYLHHV